MFSFSKIVVFILVNGLGFFSVGICYYIGQITGAMSFSDPEFDAVAFRAWFFKGTMMTWVVCAIFSFAFFFLKGKSRLVFLWIPVAIPIAYGLSVLYMPLLL